MLSFVFSLALLALTLRLSFVFAVPAPLSELSVVENLSGIPQGWQQGPRVSPSHPLEFRIALKQNNAFAFEQHVIEISTPGHPKYGNHMQHDEIKAMLRPDSMASAAVLEWLTIEGVSPSEIEDDGDWINFKVPAIDAERMLNTQFHVYNNTVNGASRIRTLQYSAPANVAPWVHMIQPTTRFGQLNMMRSTIKDHFRVSKPDRGDFWGRYGGHGLNATFCNTTMTPQCIRALYDFGPFRPDKNSKIAVTGFLDEFARYSDFNNFTKTYAPYAAQQNFSYVLINKGLATQAITSKDSAEAQLDTQYAYPLSYPTEAIYYSTGGLAPLIPDNDQPLVEFNQNEPYLDFLHYVLKLPDSELPATLSTSYGENEQSVPASCMVLLYEAFKIDTDADFWRRYQSDM